MNKKICQRVFIPILFAVSYFFMSVAALAVQCGDTIVTPTVLLQDLSCDITPANPVAVTVVGPAGSLTLLNSEISCSNINPNAADPAGVVLLGVGARLSGGKISNCPDAVRVAGNGFHAVFGTKITNSVRYGILIESKNNTVTQASITFSGIDGVVLDSSDNTVIESQISHSNLDGITILNDNNHILSNILDSNGNDGLQIFGDNNRVTNNNFENNGASGINGTAADLSIFSQNFIKGSGQNGLEIRGVDNLISQNISLENGISGILMANNPDTTNVIVGNFALDNLFDLVDVNDPGDCSADNIWLDNTFVTASPPCLD
ncbi:right-handed parallel beta-helix repeat-containing protein [Microbulbifer epialgicus]|uniref:Right-handed parallel beta-helix repeat-containing protein n=1 Tax=Microbulbifer epialgicus TaxID=393907 RepID=A0ABV4NWA9_9GAMM